MSPEQEQGPTRKVDQVAHVNAMHPYPPPHTHTHTAHYCCSPGVTLPAVGVVVGVECVADREGGWSRGVVPRQAYTRRVVHDVRGQVAGHRVGGQVGHAELLGHGAERLRVDAVRVDRDLVRRVVLWGETTHTLVQYRVHTGCTLTTSTQVVPYHVHTGCTLPRPHMLYLTTSTHVVRLPRPHRLYLTTSTRCTLPRPHRLYLTTSTQVVRLPRPHRLYPYHVHTGCTLPRPHRLYPYHVHTGCTLPRPHRLYLTTSTHVVP